MADNTQLPVPSTSGDVIAADDIGGVKFQRVKMILGADGINDGDVSSSNPLPVEIQGALGTADTKALGTNLADGDIGIISNTVIHGKSTAGGGSFVDVKVNPSGALAVSIGDSALPTGAATETTLSAINTKIPSLGQAAMAASLPVAFASNQSALSVIPSASTAQTYNVAGVIAINTILLTIDLDQNRGVSIQCTSIGTTGVVTPEWSNDNSNWVSATIFTPSGASATTFNAAGLWNVQRQARYLRLRLSTATTAGTTTLAVSSYQSQPQAFFATQPVSGTVTATVTGATQLPVTPTQSFINSAATINAAAIKASAGTVWSIICSNVNAAARYVKFYNLAVAPTVGTSVPAFTITVPAGQTVQIDGGSNGIRFGTGIAIAITGAMADSDTTVVAANEIKVATSYT